MPDKSRHSGWDALIRSRYFAFFVVVTGNFIGALDSSVVNVALPVMSKYFNVGMAGIQWVITVYCLGIVSILPVSSKLGNRYGQNRVYSLGFLLFGLGSFLCAVSPTLAALIISRFIQAMGGAMLFALAHSVISNLFTGMQRGQFLGMIGSVVAVGNITGPSVGGMLLDNFGWPALFYINLPFAAFGAYFAYKSLPGIKRPKLGKINTNSAVLFMAFSICFFTALSLAENSSLISPHILVMLAASCVLGYFFFHHERRTRTPLLNLTLYSNKVFAYGNTAITFVFISTNVSGLLLPFLLQDIYGLSAFKTGTLILFYSIPMILVSPLSGRLSGYMGSRRLTVGSMIVMICGFLWYMGAGAEFKEYQIIIGQIILGIGNGMFNSPNNNSIMSAIPRKFYNDASGLTSLGRNTGIVLGVALTVNLFNALLGYFEQGGAQHTAAFITAFHLTLCLAVCSAFIAGVLCYLGKEPDRKVL